MQVEQIDPYICEAEGRFYIAEPDGLSWFDRREDAEEHRIQLIRHQARAELVREIAAWLRKGEKPFSDCDCAAHLLETGEWKL